MRVHELDARSKNHIRKYFNHISLRAAGLDNVRYVARILAVFFSP